MTRIANNLVGKNMGLEIIQLINLKPLKKYFNC